MEKGLQRVREVFKFAETILPGKAEDRRTETLAPIGRANSPIQMSKKSELSEASDLSGLSVTPFVNPEWSDILRDAFEERAAILEHDAGYERGRSEYMARRFTDELEHERSNKD